jgi:hypothetical protein
MPTTSPAAEGDQSAERAIARDTALEPDNEDEIMPPPLPSNAPIDPEKLHILLTYSTLLALTRHSSQPVVDLDLQAQLRQLDAFLAGDVTEDGLATHWSAESASSERLQQYKDLCDQLVPNLAAAIKEQSHVNLTAHPKNRVQGEENPEHRPLSQLFLSSDLVTMYRAWAEKSRKKGINPDLDPWTDLTKFSKIIPLFKSIYEFQYDFDSWKHTTPKPVSLQRPRLDAEEFMRMMHNRDQIRVYHRVITPLGKVFSQLDVIPETTTKYTESELSKMWRDKTRPKYMVPDPAADTIPTKQKNVSWVNNDGLGKVWTRGETSWEPVFKFMVFDEATDAYIHEYLVPVDLLDQINLNDETWVTRYRKKISQWRSRVTGEATKVREPWTDDERAVVYKWANAWVNKNGVDKFLTRAIEREKDNLQATLVAKIGRPRSVESVNSWTKLQMTGKPSEPLGMLYIEGQKMAARIDAGEDVLNSERYPEEAINVADFLATAKLKTRSKHSKFGAKRKPDSDDGSPIKSGSDDDDMDDDDTDLNHEVDMIFEFGEREEEDEEGDEEGGEEGDEEED